MISLVFVLLAATACQADSSATPSAVIEATSPVAATVASSPSGSDAVPLTYTHPIYGYSITLPPGFQPQEGGPSDSALFARLPPESSMEDLFQTMPWIVINVVEDAAGSSAEEWAAKRPFMATTAIASEGHPVTIDGEPGWQQIEDSTRGDSESAYGMATYVVHGGRLYVIEALDNDAQAFEPFIETYLSTVNSVRW